MIAQLVMEGAYFHLLDDLKELFESHSRARVGAGNVGDVGDVRWHGTEILPWKSFHIIPNLILIHTRDDCRPEGF